ncbi:hypothetical protein [Pseudoxanthomonas daejeonensis]|uniref:Secreted protein n=1 Tax=Pseudoxanthomonas daejeonensis TaxID=266062 RepID=A0ABQ6Z858_9GAMM|nr:hypothetical protein CSC65_06330 [Pseudoxanthomonas daejeonensis]
MGTLPIILMSVLGGWAVLATVLAVAWGRNLRHERGEHEAEQERNARYRAALRRLEGRATETAAQFEALEREYLVLRRRLEAEAPDTAPEERPFPMVVIDTLDISGEIGLLFEHVARVATAIRGYSAFTRGHSGPEPQKARYDLLWLADCLHTFDRIGRALAGGSQRSLAVACEELLSMYDMYPRDGSGYDSRDTFRRLAERVPLGAATEAVRSIAMKVAAAPERVDRNPPVVEVVAPAPVASVG